MSKNLKLIRCKNLVIYRFKVNKFENSQLGNEVGIE